MTKLLWVVYLPDEQRLEATVEDAAGKRRRIDYRWKTRDASPPPPDWFEAVCGEVELQRSDELDQKLGRNQF